MKRYKIYGIIGASTLNPIGKLPCKMVEDLDGEWVKRGDVVLILSEKDAYIERMRKMLSQYAERIR